MKMKKKTINKILIVGGSGFVGKHLVKELKKKKFNIIKPKKKFFNLRNKKLLIQYLSKTKPTIIINLASSTVFLKNRKDEHTNHHNNTFITSVNLAKHIDNKFTKLAIFFGSIEEYGHCKLPKKENSKFNPLSIYGKSKRKAYLEVSKELKKKNINYLWIRPSLVYGDKDNKDRYLGYIIHQIKDKKEIIIKPGNQIRDYLFVDDLVRITVFFIKNFKKNYNFSLNISSKNFVNLYEVPKKINNLVKKPIEFTILKNKKKLNKMQDNMKFIKIFPKFKFTSFKNGLKKTLQREKIIN